MNARDTVIVPIHKAGYPFIAIFILITIAMAVFIPAPFGPSLGWVGTIATAWCIYFFRNPYRVTPDKEGLIVATGDGVVHMIEKAAPPPELEMGEEPLIRISTFLNVFNVHVNRVPVAGKITKLHYHKGKFFNAALDKASLENERQSAIVETKDGTQVAFVQIAGLVARRILCFLEDNQEVKTGEQYGIIRFGSRCDVYLPKGIEPLVTVGQLCIGGETILADLNSEEKARTGTKH